MDERCARAASELRTDAIAQLNAKTEEAKKPRKPRGPNKPKVVDMGPSEPVITPQKDISVLIAPQAPSIVVIPEPVAVPEPSQPVSAPVAPATPGKPRLSPEQVKPFRQRLFKVVNDHLEPNGFTPKEGMGNADKLRAFANILFPEVTNLNELTVEQWEKYLTTLENKIKTEGAKATITYIEDAIGV